jgi:hypothetical protein
VVSERDLGIEIPPHIKRLADNVVS